MSTAEEAALRLEDVRRRLEEGKEDPGLLAPEITEILFRQERALTRLVDEFHRLSESDREVVPFPEPPETTGLEDIEAVHAELEAARESIADLNAKVELGHRFLDQAEAGHRAAAVKARQGSVGENAEYNELAAELAADHLQLVQVELDNDRTSLAHEKARLARLEKHRDIVEQRLRLDPADIDRIMNAIDEAARGLSRELVEAQQRVEVARTRLGSSGPAAIRDLEIEAAESKVALISRQLDRLDSLRALWRQRLSFLGGEATQVEVAEWLDEQGRLASELDLMQRRSQIVISQLIERRERALAEEPVANGPRRASMLAAMLELERADLDKARALTAVHRRFVDELRRQRSAQLLKTGAAGVFRTARTVWTWEITAIDGRSLTVGKVVVALLVLILGGAVARRVMRRVARRWLARVGIEAGAAAAFEVLGFYVVMVGLVIFALWVAEIPLTVFTLAGGALAIGIGFGSQNVLANFISGLIILAERPIKVGDLIEVDQVIGQVERIGARSTTVKTSDNVHLIVPNSAFLENNVVNWTHSDNLVRINLDVGVAYGSPTRTVERLLLEALEEHPKVLRDPAPVILFEDFGDNALAFRAVVWIVMRRPMDRRRTLSELRHRVDALFREAEIVIAYPQRDVHLDTLSPLKVEVIPPEAKT